MSASLRDMVSEPVRKVGIRCHCSSFLASREAGLNLSPHLVHPLVRIDKAADACEQQRESPRRQTEAQAEVQTEARTPFGR